MKTSDPSSDPSSSPSAGELARLAGEYGIEFLATVTDDMLDPSLVAKLPVDWARSNCLLPVKVNGETCVLTASPDDMSRQEYLSLLIGAELRPVLATRDEILRGIERCYYSKEDSTREFLKDLAG